MIGLLQRVTSASVIVDKKQCANIDTGLLVFIGIEKNDNESKANRLLERLLGYRIFPDAEDKMNLSLKNINGDLLLVPQFTLPANTQKGTRPSFTPAASPEIGKQLFGYFCTQAKDTYSNTSTGIFGADMKVSLINDGPVTFWLQT